MMYPLLLAAFLLTASGVHSVTLIARLSSGGIKGTVSFSQTNPGDAVDVTFNLTGISRPTFWQIHPFRLNYDVADRCSVARLGARILPLENRTVEDAKLTGFNLNGVNTLEGRSLALIQSDVIISCGTIESTGAYVTASATFTKNVIGVVVFRQVDTSAPSATRLIADLYYDGSQTFGRSLEWRVVVNDKTCSGFLGIAYNPTGVTGQCSSSNQTNCAIGNLSGKLNPVTVGAQPGASRLTFIDLNLPLKGKNGVIGMKLVLHEQEATTPLACAVIRQFQPRSGVATFNNDGVTGSITMSQSSPLDPTTTHVNLINLRSLAGGYHVHNFPVPQRVQADQLLCSDKAVSGHYNPFDIIYNANSPAAGIGTEDQYEVGDLSKKYGLLTGLNTINKTFTDWNLQLFGPHSVLGRSLVIHNATTGARWICVNIIDTANVTTAMATFTYPVIGHVMLQQREGDEMAETSVYVELDYSDGSTISTSRHLWAVHSNPASSDALSTNLSTRCASAGEVINPMAVNNYSYSEQCSPVYPMRCKMGDLSAKHASLAVRAVDTWAKAFFTDVFLPLQGDNSVVGKSIVLMSVTGSGLRLSCATINKIWPLSAKVSNWGNIAHGSITFIQIAGIVHMPTMIQLDLVSLPGASTSYQINTLPVNSTNRCESVGGVYNPFSAAISAAGRSTVDQFPVGDLSGKFGVLNLKTVSRFYRDPNLDLFGPSSVIGRSVSLKSPDLGITLCGDVTSAGVYLGMLVEAKAVFTGDVIGEIILRQYLYPNDSLSDTTVIVDLRNANNTQTLAHNWHTHVMPVGTDSQSARCASTGGHYNPFMVNVTANYIECQPANPLRCELGDQSSKLGPYDLGSGRKVATDVYLPLVGPYGVIGRSFVVHRENRGAARYACADIVPTEMSPFKDIAIKTPKEISKSDLAQKLAAALATEQYNLFVQVVSQQGECTNIRIYFLGLQGEANMNGFREMAVSKNGVLGDYQPITCGTGSAILTHAMLSSCPGPHEQRGILSTINIVIPVGDCVGRGPSAVFCSWAYNAVKTVLITVAVVTSGLLLFTSVILSWTVR